MLHFLPPPSPTLPKWVPRVWAIGALWVIPRGYAWTGMLFFHLQCRAISSSTAVFQTSGGHMLGKKTIFWLPLLNVLKKCPVSPRREAAWLCGEALAASNKRGATSIHPKFPWLSQFVLKSTSSHDCGVSLLKTITKNNSQRTWEASWDLSAMPTHPFQ